MLRTRRETTSLVRALALAAGRAQRIRRLSIDQLTEPGQALLDFQGLHTSERWLQAREQLDG